jgi:hypothetical protein
MLPLLCSGGCGCRPDRMVEVEEGAPPQPLCVFCEDGEPCPMSPRPQPAASAAAPTLRKESEEPVKDTRSEPMTCKGFECECTNVLSDRNRTGMCTRCYARRLYRQTHPESKRTPGKAREMSKKKDTAPAKMDAGAAPTPAANGHTVMIAVNEEQLNRLILGWPLEDKTRLANALLRGEL